MLPLTCIIYHVYLCDAHNYSYSLCPQILCPSRCFSSPFIQFSSFLPTSLRNYLFHCGPTAVGARGGGVLDRSDALDIMHGRNRMATKHPCNAGTEHVGFSPTRQILLAPSAKRRRKYPASRMKGELHLTKNRL